ncbi:UNVERIFIED_CONTAM: Codeine O-demethylase [Sesamum latifolium]|uniref:Codeine O-demethylase n=1 Tax=Sesamum latifolium TaxID=2727402 RepID=A0AAW2UEM3_9LAMI
MAGVSAPPAEVLLSKRVQELVITGEDPSGPYVCRNDNEELDATTENSPIPVVNIGHFLSGKWSDDESVQELKKLHSALSTWGCFQAIGHGIPSCFLDEVRGVGREFFEQPMEEKNKYAKTVTEFQGYGADPLPEEGQSLDWSDRLFLELVPQDQRNYRFWPQNPPSFKGTLEEYSEKMKTVTEMISKSMARSLHLEETCFFKQFGEGAQLGARFNYYSPCRRPDLVLGLKPHADGSGYTLYCRTNPAFNYSTMANGILSPRTLMPFLSSWGTKWRSPVHRVLSNRERDRISVAVFYTPEVGKEIGPEEGLISAEAPRVFKMVKDYANIHWEYYQKGMRSLHTVKV